MGLISRVSSRTYRKNLKKDQNEYGPLNHQQTSEEEQPARIRHREQRREHPPRSRTVLMPLPRSSLCSFTLSPSRRSMLADETLSSSWSQPHRSSAGKKSRPRSSESSRRSSAASTYSSLALEK